MSYPEIEKINSEIAETAEKEEKAKEVPCRAAISSAVCLLTDILNVYHLSHTYHPEEGLLPVGESPELRKDVACQLLFFGERVRLGLLRNRVYLQNEEIWETLCKANLYPATVRDIHAPCYAAGVHSLGRKLFIELLFPPTILSEVIPGDRFDYLPGGSKSKEYPELDPEKTEAGVERILRMLALGRDFSSSLITAQLWKEYQRASGKLPDRADSEEISPPAEGTVAADIIRLTNMRRSPEQIVESDPRRFNIKYVNTVINIRHHSLVKK